jgi:hypothetical protein
MASIIDLCWNSAEELFEDLDLDRLYVRQVEVMGTAQDQNYPYIVVVFTGKITIGLNLGCYIDPGCSSGDFLGGLTHGADGCHLFSWVPSTEPSE